MYAVFAVRATTPSCGHVRACWLLMGNHHGNQCHVMSSRSPGNLPFLFFYFFFIPLQKRGEERWYRLKKKDKIGRFRSQSLTLADWTPECRWPPSSPHLCSTYVARSNPFALCSQPWWVQSDYGVFKCKFGFSSMYLRIHVSAKSMCVRICANASNFHVNEFHENIFISCNFHIRAWFAFEFMLISSLPHSTFPSPVLISFYSILPLTCL